MAIKKIKTKKAIFFSLFAVLLAAIIILLLKPPIEVYNTIKLPSTSVRLEIYDANIKAIENNYIYYVTHDTFLRALLAYTAYLKKEGPENNLQKTRDHLKELMLNSSIDGTAINTTPYDILYLENKTLPERFRFLEELLNATLKMHVNITIINLSVYQANTTGPFGIGLQLNYTLLVNQSPIALWYHNVTTNITVSIKGLEDPFYYVNTYSTGKPMIMHFQPSNITKWNFTTFQYHLGNRTYIYRKEGLSYLQRLANSTENPALKDGITLQECCGLESVINQSESFKLGGSLPGGYYKRAFIDYCYLIDNPSCTGTLYNISDYTTDSFPIVLINTHFAWYIMQEKQGPAIS